MDPIRTAAGESQAEAAVEPPPLAWPEAIACLAAERTRAITCAAQAKALPDGVAALAAAYGEAKAEMDGVIAGLTVALAEGRKPDALDDLPRRIEEAATKRVAFCRAVAERLPPAHTGTKSVLSDVLGLGKLVKELVDAVLAIWDRVAEPDKYRRDAIRAQLEATRWPEFADVPQAG